MKPRVLLTATLTLMAAANIVLADPVITEFMAVNDAVLADGSGHYPDWIEIHNPETSVQNLAGYLLADADGEWAFPADVEIPPQGYLVVFASGRDPSLAPRDDQGNLHTDFQLGREGESLFLKSPSGDNLSSFGNIPRQRADISYGEASNGSIGYFKKATPGSANNLVTLGFVGDTKFSTDRGYHTEPVEITISVEPSDATILYTTDGSTPDKGTIFTGPVGTEYAGPITIDKTTVLKAIALKDGWESSDVDSQTYIFLDQVLTQSELPEGYPDKWGANLADYEMDPDIVNDPAYKDAFDAAFAVFPTLSLGIKREAMFQRKDGIYQNTLAEGAAWERATTAEFIFPSEPEESFSVSCGIRIQGGSSRAEDIPKHSFSLRFREDYGLGELAYPFFKDQPGGETAVERFDYLQLRSGFNFAWTHRHYYQSRHAQYNRDQWVNDLYLAMGQPGIHGRWFHLYINGLYWGMYHLHERPDANYMAAYFGGSKDDYDAVNSGQATDGNLASWNRMWALARDADDPDVFAEVETQLNVNALIDYMLLNYYVGNWDWDGHNWRAAGASAADGPRWHFFPWDSEFAIAPNGAGRIDNPAPIENALTVDRTNVGGGANRPSGLHALLMKSSLYKQRFDDRAQQHFFNGGALSPEGAGAIWRRRSDLMDIAVVAESARWGDYKRDLVPGNTWTAADFDLYTKNDHYLPNQKFIVETYIPQRTEIVLEQLRDKRLISKATAPNFAVGDQSQHGGMVPTGEAIRFTSGGNIFYTLDGADPMEDGALTYDANTGIILTQSATVKARSRTIFGEWSPLAEALFIAGQIANSENLIISEIHYNPAAPSDAERADGHVVRSDFEFIELTNVGSLAINLVGLTFSNGIDFRFANDHVLEPGQQALLASKANAFAKRYPAQASAVAGIYAGKLRDSGETLAIKGADGILLTEIRFDDKAPWPTAADGEGYSLERIGPGGGADPNAPDQWHASTVIGGTPGTFGSDDGTPAPEVTYEAWRDAIFTSDQLNNPAVSSLLADLDNDQRVTLVEFILGSSPVEADTDPAMAITSTHLSVSRRTALVGATLTIERSGDLETWQDASDALNASSEQVIAPNLTRFTYAIAPAMRSGYFRLRAAITP